MRLIALLALLPLFAHASVIIPLKASGFAGRMKASGSGNTVFLPLNQEAAPETPDTIAGSNLTLWIKADSITANDGDLVTTWSDSSGNGYHFTENTNKPTYKTNIQNALPVVRFDGTNDLMTSTAKKFDLITATESSNWVVFATQGAVDSVATGSLTYGNETVIAESTNPLYGFFLRTTGGNQFVDFWNYDTDGDPIAAPVTQGVFAIYEGRHEGGNIYISKNGGADSSAASGDSLTASNNLIYLSKSFNNTFSPVDIAEVIVCDSALDATKRAAIRTYLNTKWAVY